VVEVKHWTAQWINGHSEIVTREAEKVTSKARKIGTTLRRVVRNLPRVDGAILLTTEPSTIRQYSKKLVRGVPFFTLNDWKDLIQLESPPILSSDQVKVLGNTLEPRSAVAMEGSLRRLAGYVNLELQTPKDERFHRIYRGIHSARQDRVELHLYDLSASTEKKSKTKARRYFEALHHLQLYTWAPRILDSFQDVPGYPGEMYFFTLVDPAAPCLQERVGDVSWDTAARLLFTRNVVGAVKDMHEIPIVHRNLTPKKILVKHDNTPILTGFDLTKIPSDISIASTASPTEKWEDTTAPEVRAGGLAAADQRSDVFALCASMRILFEGREDEDSRQAMEILDRGMVREPEERSDLQNLDKALSKLIGVSSPSFVLPQARFWTEEQVVPFNDGEYRIVAQLGSGGVGTAFKVVEIDQTTKEDLGTYVAKVVHEKDVGQKVLKAYKLARSHLGRHMSLSAIYEIAKEWRDNDFLALMTWVEGHPLGEFTGVFPLLAEEQQETSSEALAIRWLRIMCDALDVLHRNGLIHGDVSPRNIIYSNSDLVLTDYDFVTKIGEPITSPATILYSSPSFQDKLPATPSDDIYALAASFFSIVFDRAPFRYGGNQDKKRGLNWEGIDRDEYPTLVSFLGRATHPEPDKRFSSVAEALKTLEAVKLEEIDDEELQDTRSEVSPEIGQEEGAKEELSEKRVEWLLSLLQSYPGSRWGNRETRGLDTDFAAATYVETNLEETLLRDIRKRRVRLVILCGNAGDGKTALLQHLAKRLGLGKHHSSERILKGQMEDGLVVRMNLDGSASLRERSADEILDEFFEPFQEGPPSKDIVHLLAINDGRLLEWIERIEHQNRGNATVLTQELYELLQAETATKETHIRFINLNRRSLVGGVTSDRKAIQIDFLEQLLDHLYGGDKASAIWAPCQSCSAKERGPDGVPELVDPEIRQRARRRLFEALQAVHLRGETHITIRELRASLVYILFGVHFCEYYHDISNVAKRSPYWDRAFDPYSLGRQGEVLRELERFDPAQEAHPQIDRYLLSRPFTESTRTAPRYEGLDLGSARRWAYFEWTEEHIEQIANDSHALDLSRGRDLLLFRDLALTQDSHERQKLCERLCAGISRLEELPPQALDRQGVVPLRIIPRTPTETAFWVEKPINAFRIEADLPSEVEGVDRLHRHAFLIYRYRDGKEEHLRLGAELFHILLELSEGYQLGDVSTDDTFANLSIFIQRLVREDERELLVWNPMQDEAIHKVFTRIDVTPNGHLQRIVLNTLIPGGQP